MRRKAFKLYESCIKVYYKWLNCTLVQSRHSHFGMIVLNKYLRILRCRGKKEAIRFCKESRASIYQWLTTTDSIETVTFQSSKKKIPRTLRTLVHKGLLDYPNLRLVLSALYVSRGLELPPVPNVKSITQKPTHSGITDYSSPIRGFWEDLGIRHSKSIPKSVFWKKFHMTTKTGPNGHALWSAVADLAIIPDSLKESIMIVGGPALTMRLKMLTKHLKIFLPFFRVSPRRFRKVSSISDQEGKTREIAILDYWSQSSLRGLHNYLYRILRRIPQDCTFNQGGFQEKINSWPKDQHFYSVDLKAATDRFPMELICQVLKGRFTDEYVNSWRNIMVGYQFDSSSGPLRYGTGNPMGAYSSWASFAVAHHFVMYVACGEAGVNWKNAPYVILGDDIVIKHDKIAQEYMKLLWSLGIEFSASKTHISPFMFEFAKRIVHKGTEITPFPLSALWSTRNSPSLTLNIIATEVRKGWTSPKGIPFISSELYRIRGFNSTYVKKKFEIFHYSFHLMEYLSGRITTDLFIKQILGLHYPEKVEDPGMDFLLRGFVIHSFKDSLKDSFESLDKRSDKPLGLIAEQLVMLITGRDDMIEDACDLIQSLPVLQVHGQVEEKYMALKKGEQEWLVTAIDQDWKDLAKAVVVPVSDEIYFIRNQELLTHASFVLAGRFRTYLDKQFEPVIVEGFTFDW